MKKKQWLTVDDCRLILALHKRGRPAEAIAEGIGLSCHSVRRVIQFYNFFKEIEQ